MYGFKVDETKSGAQIAYYCEALNVFNEGLAMRLPSFYPYIAV